MKFATKKCGIEFSSLGNMLEVNFLPYESWISCSDKCDSFNLRKRRALDSGGDQINPTVDSSARRRRIKVYIRTSARSHS